MRLWHFGIVKSLPELQLRSQWRECVAIAKDLSETGFTHHLLINRLMHVIVNTIVNKIIAAADAKDGYPPLSPYNISYT